MVHNIDPYLERYMLTITFSLHHYEQEAQGSNGAPARELLVACMGQ